MSDEEVLFARLPLNGGQSAGLVTLNAEKTLNSLTLNMVDLMAPQLAAWEADESILFVVFQAAGERAFCAGGDIQNLYHDMVEHPGGPCPYCEAFFEREYRLDHQIHTFSKPTLVWAHGIVMGGGLGIASACSHRIGTERTRIAMPEITIGLIPDAGATWSFCQMPKHCSHFLAWTGANINGSDAKYVNLVDHLLNASMREELLEELQAQDWRGDVAEIMTRVIGTFEAKATDLPDSLLKQHEPLLSELMGECLGSENPTRHFAEQLNRLAGDNWLEKAAQTFRQGAPTTAQIIPEQFRRAESMDLATMLRQELTLAVQCSRHPDFAEGVRALLIDKTNDPAWRHGQLGGVPEAWIEEHFEEPWPANPMADLGT